MQKIPLGFVDCNDPVFVGLVNLRSRDRGEDRDGIACQRRPADPVAQCPEISMGEIDPGDEEGC